MNRTAMCACLILVLSLATLAQEAPTLPSGLQFPARMVSGVNAKKAKVGDEVKLEMAVIVRGPNDTIALPRGAKLIGTVTQASNRKAGGGVSSLSFVVTRAEWKGGSLALYAVPSAVAAPRAGGSQDPSEGRDIRESRNINTSSNTTDSAALMASAIANDLKGVEIKDTGDPRTATAVVSDKRDVSIPAGTIVTLRQLRAPAP